MNLYTFLVDDLNFKEDNVPLNIFIPAESPEEALKALKNQIREKLPNTHSDEAWEIEGIEIEAECIVQISEITGININQLPITITI